MLEDLLFEMYKETCIGNAEKFKKMVAKKHKLKDANNLYIKIINYQVNKYGGSLDGRYANKNYEKVRK